MAYANGYTYRRILTVDNTKVSGSTDLTNFPVLIKGTYTDLKTVANGGHVQHASGYDIRFENAAGTKLDHWLESWDATTGDVVAWVEVPTLAAASDTAIHMYYGKSGLSATEENKTGAWGAYTGVWPLSENGGGPGSYKDVTGNNDGTDYGVPDPGNTGPISKAVGFYQSADTANYIDVPSVAMSGDITIHLWVKPTQSSQSGNAQFIYETSGGRYRLYTTGTTTFKWRVYKTTGTLVSFTGDNLGTGTWKFCAIRIKASEGATTYVNGAQSETSATVDSLISVSSGFKIGGSGVAGQSVAGIVADVFVSNQDLGADWITTTFNSQSSPSTFYSVGAETTNSGAVDISGASLVMGSLF